MTLLYLTLAWTTGMVLAHVLGAPWRPLLVVATLAAGGAGACRRRPVARGAVLLMCVAALGGARYGLAQPVIDAAHPAFYNGRTVTLRGRVIADPDVRGTTTHLVVAAEAIAVDGAWRPVRGRALVSVPSTPARAYGDRLHIVGGSRPAAARGFDYRAYLAGGGIHSLCGTRRSRLPPTGGSCRCALIRLRRPARTDRAPLPDPRPACSPASSGLGHTLRGLADAFRVTGLTHHRHLGVTPWSSDGQYVLPRSASLVGLWASLGAVAVYAALVGLSPPVTRAAIMGADHRRRARGAQAATTALAAAPS